MFVYASYATDPINDVARKMLTEDVKIHVARNKVNQLMNVRQKEDLPRSLWEKYDANVKSLLNGETVLNEQTAKPETLDELSAQTLGSYIKNAKDNKTRVDMDFGHTAGTGDPKAPYTTPESNKKWLKNIDDLRVKSNKRSAGIELATDKLVKKTLEEEADEEVLTEEKKNDWLKQAADYAAKKRTATTGEERANFDKLELNALRKAGIVDNQNNTEIMEEGKDEGKPGKNFAKIANKAAKEYGSKEAGERVAGAIRKKVLAKLHESEAPLAGFTLPDGKKVEVDGKPFTETMPAQMAPEGDQKAHDASLQKPIHPPTLEESVKRIMEGVDRKKMADALKQAGNDPKKIDPNMFNEPAKPEAPKAKPEGPIKFDATTKPVDGNVIDAAYKVLKQTSRFVPVMPVTAKDRFQHNKSVTGKTLEEAEANQLNNDGPSDLETLDETAFGDAFKQARAQGLTQFTFNGKSYGTRLATETNAAWKVNMSKVAPTPAPRPADRAPVVNGKGEPFNPNGMDGDKGETLSAVGKAQTMAANPAAAALTAPKPAPTQPTIATVQPGPKTLPSTVPMPNDFSSSAGQISSTNLNQALNQAVTKVQQQAAQKPQGSILKEQEEIVSPDGKPLLKPVDFYKDGRELNKIQSILAMPKIDLSGKSTVEQINEQLQVIKQAKPVKSGDPLDGFDLDNV